MVLADANYKIIYMDVGNKGRISDGGVFSQCTLSQAFEKNSLNIPSATPLQEHNESVPYVIVADDAFPLKPYIMKPFAQKNLSGPERIFNYRLSRARRVVENVFGIMSARFRILLKPINLDENKTKNIVIAICALHNYLLTCSNVYAQANDFDQETDEGEIIEGRWRTELENINGVTPLEPQQHQKNPAMNAKDIRNVFKDYFMNCLGSTNIFEIHVLIFV